VSKSKYKKRVLDSCGGVCVVCGCPGYKGNPLTVHHLRASSRGGQNTVENCVIWHKQFHHDYHKKYGVKMSDCFGCPI